MDSPLYTAEALSGKASPIRAELAWSDTATALGIVARSPSPVLLLCRKLIATGHDPGSPLEAWRGPILCLRVRSIGEGACLAVKAAGHGPPIFTAQERAGGALARLNGGGGS